MLRSLTRLARISSRGLLKLEPHVRTLGTPLRAAAAVVTSQPIRCQSEQLRYETVSDWMPASEVKLDKSSRYVNVQWGDGKQDCYPYVWLRDNCQCSKCFEPSALGRLLLMPDLDINVDAADTWLESDGACVAVKWADGHESKYKSEWLQYRSFSDDGRKRRAQVYGDEKQLWGGEYKIPKIEFNDVLNSDEHMLEFLTTLDKRGLVLLVNAPLEPGQLMKICNAVAFMRQTHYGLEFTVKSKGDPSNLAYTSAKLGLHTDQPYYDYVPSIQMLHCIKQFIGEGGDNQFTDAFNVAYQIKREDPEAYKTLTTVPLDFWDIGTDAYGKFHKATRVPTVQLKRDGTISRIHCNNQSRDSYLNAPLDKVDKIYYALKRFDDGLYEKRNVVEYKMNDGDIVVYDNKRAMHGRLGFSASGDRHLEGGYMEWDEALSKIRVLKSTLNKWK